MRVEKEEAPLSELISDLARETVALASQELSLARVEFRDKFTHLSRGIALIALGGVVAYAGMLALIAGIILLLGQIVAWWISAFLVGLAVAGGGYLLFNAGVERLRETDVVPHKTIQTLKEDAEWAKALGQ